jgi:hypothetical protein
MSIKKSLSEPECSTHPTSLGMGWCQPLVNQPWLVNRFNMGTPAFPKCDSDLCYSNGSPALQQLSRKRRRSANFLTRRSLGSVRRRNQRGKSPPKAIENRLKTDLNRLKIDNNRYR